MKSFVKFTLVSGMRHWQRYCGNREHTLTQGTVVRKGWKASSRDATGVSSCRSEGASERVVREWGEDIPKGGSPRDKGPTLELPAHLRTARDRL